MKKINKCTDSEMRTDKWPQIDKNVKIKLNYLRMNVCDFSGVPTHYVAVLWRHR